MPRRLRNTKTLSQRIDRRYLKQLFPIPLWRRILTGVCLGIALLWVGIYALTGNPTIYTSGPLTPSHSFLGKNCQSCHGADAAIGKRVTAQQCAACHDAPVHNARQLSEPACIECHPEHRGHARLAAGTDGNCAACHDGLQAKGGALTIASSVSSFGHHPEFRAVRDKQSGAGIKFNHMKHVVELEQKCDVCHQPMPSPQPHKRVSDRALMKTAGFADSCAQCHTLTIDDKIPAPAPHDKPAIVHGAVVDELTKYAAANPKELGKEGTPATAAAWVKFKVEASEKVLWETTCGRCHTMLPPDAAGMPVIAPSKITARWFPRSVFDHGAHQQLTCESCHVNGKKSTTSAEVMLPGIAVCQRCHTSAATSAGAQCATCHVYHDWTKEKGVEGKIPIGKIGD